jgi:hypothetical protein
MTSAEYEALQIAAERAIKRAELQFARTGRFTDIEYPWIMRPLELPIAAFEAALAMSAANEDHQLAARMLRISPSRRRRELIEISATEGDGSELEKIVWRKRPNAPLIANVSIDAVNVLIKSQKFKYDTHLARDDEGNIILVVQRVYELTEERKRMVRKAQEILNEAQK